jgi:hypothetical protein
MNAASRTLRACITAGAMFLACVGVMLLLGGTRKSESPGPPDVTNEKLDAPREIEGVPCIGWASITAEGRLAGCVLSREHSFGSVTLPSNTQIRRFHPGMTPKDVHLGRDTVLDGHACLGRGPGEWMTGFHPDGRLEYCFLVADETIDGIPCRSGSFWGEITGGVIVKLHDNGRLAACRLAADVTIAGKTYAKGARIALDPVGNVVSAATGAR